MFREGDPASYHGHSFSKGEVNIQYILGDGELRTGRHAWSYGDLLLWSALVEPYKATALGTDTKVTQLARSTPPNCVCCANNSRSWLPPDDPGGSAAGQSSGRRSACSWRVGVSDTAR